MKKVMDKDGNVVIVHEEDSDQFPRILTNSVCHGEEGTLCTVLLNDDVEWQNDHIVYKNFFVAKLQQ